MSEKHIPDTTIFASSYEVKFNEILNGANKNKGKGKGRNAANQDKELPMPTTNSSHAKFSKFPFDVESSRGPG